MMRPVSLTFTLLGCLVAFGCRDGGSAALGGQVLGKTVVEPFEFGSVTLSDDTWLKTQFLDTKEYYLRIPNDDLLKPFRERAGRPAPGERLGGWYDAGSGHVFYQIVSGYARMYAITGDERCRDKARTLIEEWARCIEPDGYFLSRKGASEQAYLYDKAIDALLDMDCYCGDRRALGSLDRITGVLSSTADPGPLSRWPLN